MCDVKVTSSDESPDTRVLLQENLGVSSCGL